MMADTRLAAPTTSFIVAPASPTSFVPASTRSTEAPMRLLISLAAAALRCASERTSVATTAKPRPCSPARAASTAAFKARMLVWKAMPSITPMMSAIWRDEPLISSIVVTTRATTAPPRIATSAAVAASSLAVRALCTEFCTVPFICSIDAAVCCRLDAASSVRDDRSMLPSAISAEAMPMLSVEVRTCDTSVLSESCIEASAFSRRPVSSRSCDSIDSVRSSAAMRCAASTARWIGRVMPRTSQADNNPPRISDAAPKTTSARRAVRFSAWMLAPARSIDSACRSPRRRRASWYLMEAGR